MELSRITTGWNLGRTNTFRLSSSKLLGIWGTNVQNPSEAVCKVIIPDTGKSFVQVDQAGAEALVVAYLTRAGRLRELFSAGIKSHIYVAMHLFKDYWDQKLEMPSGYVNHVFCSAKISDLKSIPNWGILAELIKNDSERYFIGKKTCHSSNYGIEAAKFRISILKDSEGKVVLSYEQATQFLVLYHSLFPEIRDWHRRVEQELKTNERLSNLFGFPREFSFHRIDTKLLMEAYAFVPQSTVGTLTNIAYTEMFEYIEEQNLEEWDLLNNKHDSYLLQCPPEDTTRAAVKMKELIAKHEFTSPIDKATFHMKSEAAVGQNWGKYHKIYNPEGMKELVC